MAALRRLLSLAVLACVLCAPTHPQPRAPLLDINTATLAQLKALPGMGEAYARRVIAGRPYTAKNQLVTRGILPQQVYARFQNGIVAKRIAK
jgi:DNA uptake protein ComE-like DNA-binding protein